MSFNLFATELGKRESGGKYDIVNKWGFMGKYQFGKPRLYDLGYSLDGWHPKDRPMKTYLSKVKFLTNPELQEKIFLKHVKDLKKQITKKYSQYFGTKVDGITITLSGLIAGAHLLGMGGVSAFLRGEAGEDALGTSIREYVSKFANHNLDDV